MTKPVKIGIIGCGNISESYMKRARTFEILDVAACADLDLARATARAEQFDIPKACSVDELLADPAIEIVVNLTIPNAHASIGLAALKAGKHHHVEKPLAISRAEAKPLVDLAEATGLRIGGAPDTFLGGGLQTCRKLIDDGVIGDVVATSAFMICHGHESWHPDPAFYYKPGGGPMFDMGPYYLTALVSLVGPVARVTGSTRITFPERTIGSEPKKGETIRVEVPTHITGTMEYANGAIGTLIITFDCWHSTLPPIEIHGTKGSMQVPDPNGFGGPVRIRLAGEDDWREVPLTHGYTENCRSIGVADMAAALRSDRPHRASGALAYHVLDLMEAFHDAADQGRRIDIESSCDRPAPLPLGLEPGTLDV